MSGEYASTRTICSIGWTRILRMMHLVGNNSDGVVAKLVFAFRLNNKNKPMNRRTLVQPVGNAVVDQIGLASVRDSIVRVLVRRPFDEHVVIDDDDQRCCVAQPRGVLEPGALYFG